MADWRWWQWILALWGGVAVARILASTLKSPEQVRAEAEAARSAFHSQDIARKIEAARRYEALTGKKAPLA